MNFVNEKELLAKLSGLNSKYKSATTEQKKDIGEQIDRIHDEIQHLRDKRAAMAKKNELVQREQLVRKHNRPR
ncbi:MAG: hypothetical protein CL944_02150 [Candidatus Diapherotrites archaeon]|uniref:Uncharacterized protein n=1 Tax=Candidatus Iainarchaeum sp. TaxID=3101447 RepID=A0A2D6LQ57_9ARCH|nr:hypothetical protein [Candidatus Diapherotrites archaeon]|tara:strand:- start:9402 stop:9620 length:219 start_codon:yes stop_codon:yes gene_type:complete